MLNILLSIAFFNSLLFSAFLLSGERRRNYSNRYLSLLLIFMSLGFVDHYYQMNYSVLEYPQFLFIFNFTFIFATPLLLIYTKFSVDQSYRLSWMDFFLFTPALFLTLFFIFEYHILSHEQKLSYIREIPTDIFIGYIIPILGYLFCFICIYFAGKEFVAVSSIANQKSKITSNQLKLLRFLLGVFLIFSLTGVLNFLFDELLSEQQIYHYIVIVEVLSWFGLSLALIYYGLDLPDVFLQKNIKKKYQTSELKEVDKALYKSKLLDYMKEERPYLKTEININMLSELTNIPAKYLSQVINEEYKMNFFNFINSYRVEDVKRRLENGDHHDKVLLGIALDAGFNSKAAFNRAFKKHLGITPTNYIKSLKSI